MYLIIVRKCVSIHLMSLCDIFNMTIMTRNYFIAGGFGVMSTPQNVQNAYVHGSLLWKMTELFLHSIICPLEIICNQFQSWWNHSWYIENGDFIVHWSKNTSFVTIWVTLWITAFYEEKTKEFFITFFKFQNKNIQKQTW